MAETTKKPRRSVTHRFFISRNGEESARATPDTKTIVIKSAQREDLEARFELADAFGGTLPPPCVGLAAAAFGILTSAGNAGGSAEKDGDEHDPEDVIEAVSDRFKVFSSGVWAAERGEGGPRTTILLEALKRYRESHGADVSDAKMEEFRTKLADPDYKKKYLSDQGFRAVLEKLKLERQTRRAEEAASRQTGEKSAELLN